ncbi:hypothetical protein EfmJHP38_28320 [Enterococcus faecium]|nr:hypothetical protein EfmJHP38_28320 [Enterococcus faecium]
MEKVLYSINDFRLPLFSMKTLTVEAKNALSDFVYDVNHKLMGDFVSMSNDEILRFQKMEKLYKNF